MREEERKGASFNFPIVAQLTISLPSGCEGELLVLLGAIGARRPPLSQTDLRWIPEVVITGN